MSILWNIDLITNSSNGEVEFNTNKKLFTKLSKEEAECNECKKKIKTNNGSTSGLKKHLITMHPDYKNELLEKKEEVKSLEKFINIGSSGLLFNF